MNICDEIKTELSCAILLRLSSMETPQVKSDIVRVIQDLPEDATVEDAMEGLYFLAKIERGLEQSEGQTVLHERNQKSVSQICESQRQ